MKREHVTFEPYTGPAGGWGSAKAVGEALVRENAVVSGGLTLLHQNKPHGYACVSCAWAKPSNPRPLEFCENGAKATAWEVTGNTATPEFFARHTVQELLTWDDHSLENAGRLTHPMRWDAKSDKYVPVDWNEAFHAIGNFLRVTPPATTVFYSSGRASLEAAYMFALFARMYGHNNLPDCSNMCHESTSVALPESIGVPVGTVTLEDFDQTDAIFFFGQNPGTNSPRMLHKLQEASLRGVPIVTFNPLRERGLERFTNPQNPVEMLTGSSTKISSQYHQVKAGGDIAAMVGMCKALLARDRSANGVRGTVLDHQFINQHVHGFDEFVRSVDSHPWEKLERFSGLRRGAIEAAAAVYAEADNVLGIYGMGITQHREGVEAVQMLVNLLLLRGNIGKPGAGILPVRGHSNVQGQRTVGITEKPELVPNDKIAEQFGFSPPRDKGLSTIDACEAILAGKINAFVMLGGNFVRAVPEREKMEAAWQKIPITAQVLTKLNRTCLIHGMESYILPCLGRTEIDIQAAGPQAVSVEDSTACIHGSRGVHRPASPHLLSEPRVIAGLAKATLEPNPKLDWDAWTSDYSLIRNAIEETYPQYFKGFNRRMWQPGGFHRPLPACNREWHTATGKANLIMPKSLEEDPDTAKNDGLDTLTMITVRSDGQFNTTVYGYDDRFRGIYGGRMVVLMNRRDIERRGLSDGDIVGLRTVADDGVDRAMSGFRVVTYNVPEGCIVTYYPETNALLPLWHHAKRSKVPAAKSIPVRVEREMGSNGVATGEMTLVRT